jgi:predicted nucleic acid-binding protein
VSFLLDTVTLSEARRAHLADPRVMRWLDLHPEPLLFISAISLGEIERGCARVQDEVQRVGLENWAGTVKERFAGRILPVDEVVAERWGRMFGELERSGRRPQLMDSLIAATALAHDLTVVTRNVRDFDRCGVTTENPWETA